MEAKGSSDEPESSSPDKPGDGRFYECIFCKRGFSTAQALGGHMNIHRKDRAKMRREPTPSPSPPKRSVDDNLPHTNNLDSWPFSSSPPVFEPVKNFGMLFPMAALIDRETKEETPRELTLFGDGKHVVVDEETEAREEGGEVQIVDLELRLGHDP